MRAFAILVSVLLLSACAAPQLRDEAALTRVAARAAVQSFELSGRVSVQAREQGFSGRIDWRHEAGADALTLFSPLGQTVAELTHGPAGARLVAADGGDYAAADGETLLRQVLGLDLPLSGLADWALGRPSGREAWRGERDAQGRLRRLAQAGWEVVFDEYLADGADALPRRIELSREADGVRGRLLIDLWRMAE